LRVDGRARGARPLAAGPAKRLTASAALACLIPWSMRCLCAQLELRDGLLEAAPKQMNRGSRLSCY